MSKNIVITKNSSQRTGLRTTSIFFMVGMIILAVWLRQLPMIGLSILFCIPVTVFLVYQEGWSISFVGEQIIYKVFFKVRSAYSHRQIQAVLLVQTNTRHPFVKLIFDDGKALTFRLDDENAAQALKRIQSHHTVTTI